MIAKYEITLDNRIVEQAEKIYNHLGIDLAAAIMMFLVKTIRVQGLPFDLTLNSNEPYQAFEAARAAIEISKHAEKKGISDMPLEEINRIIAETRKEAKARRARQVQQSTVER